MPKVNVHRETNHFSCQILAEPDKKGDPGLHLNHEQIHRADSFRALQRSQSQG